MAGQNENARARRAAPRPATATRLGRIASWFGSHRRSVTGAGLVGVAGLVLGVLNYCAPRAPVESQTVVVPSVVGVELAVAQSALSGVDLLSVVAGPVVDGLSIVQAQDPLGGTTVQRHTHVTLTTETAVTVPDLVGLQVEAAETALGRLGLALERAHTQERDDLGVDQVVAQDPPAGDASKVGSTVQVTLSTSAPAAAQLTLVDVTVTGVKPQQANVDITVRNDGDQVAIVTAVDVVIHSHAILVGHSGPIGLSATYDALLPSDPKVTTATVPVPVSQHVDPSGAGAFDKFSIRLSADGSGGTGHTYEISVRVHEAGKTLSWPVPLRLRVNGHQAFGASGPELPGPGPAVTPPDAVLAPESESPAATP